MSEKLAYVCIRCSSIFGEGVSKVVAPLSQHKHEYDYSKEFYSDDFIDKSLRLKMYYHISTTLLRQTNILSMPSARELDSNLAFRSKGSMDKTLSWTGPRTLHDVR